jgi:hypothetical protein
MLVSGLLTNLPTMQLFNKVIYCLVVLVVNWHLVVRFLTLPIAMYYLVVTIVTNVADVFVLVKLGYLY